MNKKVFIKKWNSCNCDIKMVVYMNGDICITDDYEILENEYVELKYSGYSKIRIPFTMIDEVIEYVELKKGDIE